MTMLEILPEVICSEELLRTFVTPKLVSDRQILIPLPAVRFRSVGEFLAIEIARFIRTTGLVCNAVGFSGWKAQ